MIQPTMKRRVPKAALRSAAALAVLFWVAATSAAPTSAETARSQSVVREVHTAVRQGDCSSAVRHLNLGLGERLPEVMKLAGAMYEDGVCLKASRDRAIDWYTRAFQAGQPSAGARLAALYASPGPAQDHAAALWWALQSGTALPSACTEARAQATDADRFVAALQRWPAGRLSQCTQVAAVMAGIEGELELATLAADAGATGTLRLVYEPARARLEVQTQGVIPLSQRSGTQPIDTMRDMGSAVVRPKDDPAALIGADTVRRRLETSVREVTDRILRRHPQAQGVPAIPADWRVEAQYELGRAGS